VVDHSSAEGIAAADRIVEVAAVGRIVEVAAGRTVVGSWN